MTTPYNPFKDLDRLFNSVTRAVPSEVRMPMDLYRTGDAFIVKMDLPGVDPKSIDIDVDDRTFTVRVERAAEVVDSGDEKNGWVSRERSFGTYARQISLGAGLDLAKIAADYVDGVLTLTIPVAEEAKPRKISVTTASHIINEDAPKA